MKKIAIIPARSGSKGLPNKNIMMLIDKPLIAYTIEAAVNSKVFDRVIVSTDSYEYKNIAEKYGAEVIMREEFLASDKATTYMVLEDLLTKVNKFDYFVLLQPTSPLRTSEHIIEAVNLFESNFENYDYLVSVKEAEHSNDLVKPIDETMSLKCFDTDFSNYRRQSYKEYSPNGAIFMAKKQPYLSRKHFFGDKSIAYIMDNESSADIDNLGDLKYVIFLLNEKNKEELTNKRIDYFIKTKANMFSQKKPIMLIGHSIFEKWNIDKINDSHILNLGISEITTEQYYKKVILKNYINEIPNDVFIMLGVNDIKQNINQEKTLFYLDEIVKYIESKNNESNIHICGIINSNHRYDIENNKIESINNHLKKKYKNYIDMSIFNNEYKVLNLDYSTDGLHLNDEGYNILYNILRDALEDKNV